MEKVRFETKGVLQQQLTYIEESSTQNQESISGNQLLIKKFELQIQLMQEDINRIKNFQDPRKRSERSKSTTNSKNNESQNQSRVSTA
jgi:hypothetical protein